MRSAWDPFERQLKIPKASELIAAHLRRRIVQDDLAEDESLASEATLMSEFNVSRPTLREAYRILESEGLVTVRRGAHGGARVHKPKPELAARYAALVLQSQGALLSDIFEARMIIEGPIVQIVAENAGPDEFARLREINKEADDYPDQLVTALNHHHRFHNALLDMTGNMTITLLGKMIGLILDEADTRHVEGRQSDEEEAVASRRAQRTHVQIVVHLERGHVVAADKLWRAHLAEAARLILAHTDARTALDVMN